MSVKMILQGGPLDAEQQLVLDLPRTPGSTLVFNVPNHQSFDEDENLVSLGLQVTYALLEEGPPPTGGEDVDWDSSWIFTFVEEAFLPRPPIQPTPPVPPGLQVSLLGETDIEVDATTSPGVLMVAAASMEVDGSVTPVVGDATVVMGAVTTLTVDPS